MKEKQYMELGKRQEAEVKVKEKIEAQRVNKRRCRRGRWNVAGMGRRRGAGRRLTLVLINHRDVCIHPTCFTFLHLYSQSKMLLINC